MSVNTNIYPWAGIPTTSTRYISRDLFPYVGGQTNTTCRLGQDFSGKVYGTVSSYTYLTSGTGYDIAVDSDQNVYITGQYTGTAQIYTMGLPPASVSGSTLPAPSTGSFVLKYNSAGSLLSYTYLPSTSVNTFGQGIAVDSTSVYITGQYSSTTAAQIYTIGLPPAVVSGRTLPATPSNTLYNMFALKYNASTGALVSYTYLTGTGLSISGFKIAIDSGQNVYITGSYASNGPVQIYTMGLPPAVVSGRTLPATPGNMFVLKYNSAGSLVSYTHLPIPTAGPSASGQGIAFDSTSVYITGQYSSTGTLQIYTMGLPPAVVSGRTLPASTSPFVLKYNASTGALVSYTYLTGLTSGTGYDIAVDSDQNVYITGQYTGTAQIYTMGLPPASVSGSTLPAPSTGSFVLKYNSAGSLLSYTYLPSTSVNTFGQGIAVDSTSVYITGQYSSTTAAQIYTIGLPPAVVSGRTLPATAGRICMFALKYNASTGALVSYTDLTGTGSCTGRSIVVNSSQHVHITGRYNTTGTSSINRMGLPPAASGSTLGSGLGVFVLKYPKT